MHDARQHYIRRVPSYGFALERAFPFGDYDGLPVKPPGNWLCGRNIFQVCWLALLYAPRRHENEGNPGTKFGLVSSKKSNLSQYMLKRAKPINLFWPISAHKCKYLFSEGLIPPETNLDNNYCSQILAQNFNRAHKIWVGPCEIGFTSTYEDQNFSQSLIIDS